MRGIGELAAAGLAGLVILIGLAVAWYALAPLPEAPAPAERIGTESPAPASSPAVGAARDTAPSGAAGTPDAGSAPDAGGAASTDFTAATPGPASPAEAPPAGSAAEAAVADASADAAPTAAPTTRDVGGGAVTRGPSLDPDAPPAAVAAAPAAPAEPERFFSVVAADAGTLVAGERRFRLAAVTVPAATAECRDDAGTTWPCGAAARTALRRLIQQRAVECTVLDVPPAAAAAAGPTGEAAGPETGTVGAGRSGTGAQARRDGTAEPAAAAHCSVGGTDIARWLVEHGWAEPAAEAPEDFAGLLDDARRDGRGMWQTSAERLRDPTAGLPPPPPVGIYGDPTAAPAISGPSASPAPLTPSPPAEADGAPLPLVPGQ